MRKTEKINARILNTYACTDEKKAEDMLQEEVRKSSRKIIVLDDDPTGVQTVHGISVYTDWSEESISQGFAEDNKLFYILTNSRGFTEKETENIHREIAQNVAKAAEEAKKEFIIISRSDSTLRGHYPLETQVLREEIEKLQNIEFDGEILCPFFKEGGRFTIDNVHYVREGEELVPAGETEFADDKTFGYKSSDLRDYIEEKTCGAYKKENVTCISLEELRAADIEKIESRLLEVKNFNKVVVNAIDHTDIKVFCTALYRAMAQGKKFLFRSAAALVKELGGISARPLLNRKEMIIKENSNGGVIIVGSHTQKTTRQLEELKKVPGVVSMEFDSDLVLDTRAFQEEINSTISRMEEVIISGKTAAVYTKRTLLEVPDDTKEEALLRSVKISHAVQSLVGNLQAVPAFVIAKGGITSSDVGTKALGVKRANVLGQICPGIPVWQTGKESKFPDIPYVIFPGNVGDDGTLKEAAEILMGQV